MSIGSIIMFAILVLWALITMTVLIAEALYRSRHVNLLDTRDWQEKVEAMRRLQDEEGEA